MNLKKLMVGSGQLEFNSSGVVSQPLPRGGASGDYPQRFSAELRRWPTERPSQSESIGGASYTTATVEFQVAVAHDFKLVRVVPRSGSEGPRLRALRLQVPTRALEKSLEVASA